MWNTYNPLIFSPEIKKKKSLLGKRKLFEQVLSCSKTTVFHIKAETRSDNAQVDSCQDIFIAWFLEENVLYYWSTFAFAFSDFFPLNDRNL